MDHRALTNSRDAVVACASFHAIETYLWLNLLLMNGVWLASVLYRRWHLAPNLV